MAEKKFLKGLFKDTGHIDQPEGTWRYALNAIMQEKKGSISNEGGTEIAGHLPADDNQGNTGELWKAVGAIEIDKDRVILFLKQRQDIVGYTNLLGYSEIGIWENKLPKQSPQIQQYYGEYRTLYRPDIDAYPKIDLNFSINNPIEGTFKINSKGDLIIYFTDDLNSPRAFNVDRQIRWIDKNTITNPYIWLYEIDPNGSHDNHIDLLNLFPSSGPVPAIDLDYVDTHQNSIIEGGGLRTGVYYLALAYVDEDFVATNYVTVSNPVSIVEEFDHTKPTTKKDGAKAGDQTSKAIKWQIRNLHQTDYKYIRPAIIRKMGDATEVFRLNDIDKEVVRSKGIAFTGIEGFIPGAVEDIIIDTVSYDTAKTIQQLDGVLYMGNTTGSADLGYQKYANNIKLNSKIRPITDFDTFHATVDNLHSGFANTEVDEGIFVDPTKSYRYAPNIFKYKGYTRDDVYAFYIAFILNDGSMSYAYHIPGRKEITAADQAAIALLSPSSIYAEYNIGPESETSFVLNSDLSQLGRETAKLFHFYDTSPYALGANQSNGGASRHMNYWHNANEFYPSTDNFEVWDSHAVDVSGQLPGADGSIKNLNVRHHHFPSNENLARRTIDQHASGDLSIITPSIGNFNALSNASAFAGTFVVAPTKINSGADNYELSNSWSGQYSSWRCNPAGSYTYFPLRHILPLATSPSPGFATDPLLCFDNSGAGAGAFQAQVDYTEVVIDINLIIVNNFDDVFGIGPSVHDFEAQLRLNRLGAGQPFTNPGTPIPPDSGSFQAIGIGGTNPGPSSVIGNTALSTEIPWTSSGANPKVKFVATYTVTLMAGERLFFLSKGEGFNTGVGQTDPSNFSLQGCDDPTTWLYPWVPSTPIQTTSANTSWARYEVKIGAPSGTYNDLELNHKVNILGFELEDLKIPQSIADKIQGFRIYHAKRDYSNRRVLGQNPVIPMRIKTGTLGVCMEASQGVNAGAAIMGLQTSSDVDETFLAKDAYSKSNSLPLQFYALPVQVDNNDMGNAYKYISFHDFYLMRTRNSLAPATHMKIEYVTRDYTYNGPGIKQPRKMLTEIDTTGTQSDSGAYRITERWGWDDSSDPFNCYPAAINSAFFFGGKYMTAQQFGGGNPLIQDNTANAFGSQTVYEPNRLLGQKSKSYVLGDTVFDGRSLGFAGKISNQFGESHIALGFKDGHELPALRSATNYGSASPFGLWIAGVAPVLQGFTDPVTQLFEGDTERHYSYIMNLHAFKTDMYKSIDSQELVWTGYEVIGEGLQNFIFDDDGYGIDYIWKVPDDPLNITIVYTANYSTHTHQDRFMGLAPDETGIFGGDTFICRHGFANAVTHMDDLTSSKPERGLYYHIVESTDNINFRHSESNKDVYFPNTPATKMIELVGKEDLTHIDNIKYNDNYSSVNDVRSAIPLPTRDIDQTDFLTRVLRSTKNDPTSLIDNYRIFFANEFRDLPKNKGELWKLASLNNILYFHMKECLYVTKGKQTLKMKEGGDAFVGSGDLFEQDPDEVIQTDRGYGGTQSQWCSLTTKFGYFFLDRNSRKIFLISDKINDITNAGMEEWFRNNLRYKLEDYGLTSACALDNPILGFGFHSIWDPKFKRIILTKREFKPTQAFIDRWELTEDASQAAGDDKTRIIFDVNTCQYWTNSIASVQNFINGVIDELPFDILIEYTNTKFFERDGWSISYYPTLQIWVSFHSYIPYLYFNTSTNFYSLTDKWDTYLDGTYATLGCSSISTPQYQPGQCVANDPGTHFGNRGIWKHNSQWLGVFYQEPQVIGACNPAQDANYLNSINPYPFKFEFIHNETRDQDTVLSSFNYTLEVFQHDVWKDNTLIIQVQTSSGVPVSIPGILYNDEDTHNIGVLNHGFTNFLIYNTHQLSLNYQLKYLTNVRRIGNEWHVNKFRDYARIEERSGLYSYTAGLDILGNYNPTALVPGSRGVMWEPMFNVDGMSETINTDYLKDYEDRNWWESRKFIDKWVGIRLTCKNNQNILLNLYSTNIVVRKYNR